MENTESKIKELETEIADLPIGYISKKTINGKVRQYYQWTENGEKKSKYIDDSIAIQLNARIEKRRILQTELRLLKTLDPKKKKITHRTSKFKTRVLIEEELQRFVQPVSDFKKRVCYLTLEHYIKQESVSKVFVLYGLRRTGKTTLIRQIINSLSINEIAQAAFIQVRQGDTLADLNMDLQWLSANNYRYIFLDEVTLAEDFIEGAALFSDIYVASGVKIVLSGTDSLGFIFSESEELYDRCIFLHTTFISYHEFENILGVYGIDEYIRYGGTMTSSGVHYNDSSSFSSKESTDEYINSSIARNIQHSLKYYQYGNHFRNLNSLFEKNELTSAINRVVEDMNHRFTVKVLTEDFISHDLGISRNNLRKDKNKPTDTLDRIDKAQFTEGLRQALEIFNKSEQKVTVTEAHSIEIKEYLALLDLTVDIPIEFLPVRNNNFYKTVITQPGMRYAQAEAFIQQLLLDKSFQNISITDRINIVERIMSEIRGRMMEEIVLLETKMAFPKKHVFQLQFQVGEFDMVVADPHTLTCEIYEVKYSKERTHEQFRFLVDSEKCKATEFRYGTITQKCVIYRGQTTNEGDIFYWNVEEYLKKIGSLSFAKK